MSPRSISMAETLAAGSVESFISSEESVFLTKMMDDFLSKDGRSSFDQDRSTSIHEVPGVGLQEVRNAYEPAGRVEVTHIPPEAEELLQAAFHRSIASIRRIFPTAQVCRPWTYVEYGVGQYISPHVDGIAPDPLTWPRQIAGISVLIHKATSGGEFFIETSSADRLWNRRAPVGSGYEDGVEFAHEGSDETSQWFRETPRTRWVVDPPTCTALMYGSQLTHGTEQVTKGRAKKFISWLAQER